MQKSNQLIKALRQQPTQPLTFTCLGHGGLHTVNKNAIQISQLFLKPGARTITAGGCVIDKLSS